MPETTYTYSIASDFPGGAVNPDKLKAEIHASGSGIAIQVERVDTNGDVLDLVMKDALSAGQKTALDGDTTGPAGGLIASHDNTDNAQYDVVHIDSAHTGDGRLIAAVVKPDGSRLTQVSHDWTDRTTWSDMAVRVVEELAVDSGDQVTWNLAHANVIDTIHGKRWNEDVLTDSNGFTYHPVVLVNDVKKDIVDPHTQVGDYSIDYVNGAVVFEAALNPGDVVKVTYHRASTDEKTSQFIVSPASGKQVVIESVDVQFAGDVVLQDTAVFEMYGYVDVFAPHLVNNVDPDGITSFPTGTQIPISTTKYKTMRDYQAECDRSYPAYPAMGGSGWRGLVQPTQVFHWEYLRGVPIKSSCGMELRIYLEHDEPFTGEYATATLYCVSENEEL